MVEIFTLAGDVVALCEGRIDNNIDNIDWLVCYGYRFLVAPAVLARLPHRAVNLHIAYLPWNRGADPNLWSALERTPSGVTVHEMDEGIDTGPILKQRLVTFAADDTFRSSYARLETEMLRLFAEAWPLLRVGAMVARPQCGGGSYHRSRDKAPFLARLTNGWDTPRVQLDGLAHTDIS
jgi:methionyl-tRNA formyltransferase